MTRMKKSLECYGLVEQHIKKKLTTLLSNLYMDKNLLYLYTSSNKHLKLLKFSR